MSEDKLIVLFAFTVFFGVLYTENKLGFRSPRVEKVKLRREVPKWKRYLVLWNDHLRYGGMFLIMIGSAAFSIHTKSHPVEDALHFLFVAAIGFTIYMLALAWRLIVRSSDVR